MKTPALFDLTGRVAIVTGGNGGIGRGIALGLAETGAAVAIFGRNEEKNRRVLAELKTIGVPSIAVKVDLTDRAALEPAFNRVESEVGGVSILVNNAGNVSLSGGVLNEKPEDWDNVHRDPTQRSFPSFQARRPVDAPSPRWKNYQHREHVFVLWLWACPILQRSERSDRATDQVDGD
jgi:2-dehydro-3-deoxy-D-gluconate 5-dehydrogenase